MKSPFCSSPARSPTPSRHTLSSTMTDENVELAQSLISRYNPDDPSSSLFGDDGNRQDSEHFLRSVTALQAAMRYYAQHDPSSPNLIVSQSLMRTAMARLEGEFYRILSSSQSYLDPESVSSLSNLSNLSSPPSSARSIFSESNYSNYFDDEASEDGFGSSADATSVSESTRSSPSSVVYYLRAIAESMIASGYGKECVKIYKIVRKSIVEEALYNAGVNQTVTSSRIQKMEWEALETIVKSWLKAFKFAVNSVFYGEKILCDQVFGSSEMIRESCFENITKDSAIYLLGFAESVARSKKSAEKMFQVLDMYETVANAWPLIETMFCHGSALAVRSHAVDAMVNLGEAIRYMLGDLESAIQKDTSKNTVAGGGVHPLTRYVMNYLTFLADYSEEMLNDIVADWPLQVNGGVPGTELECDIETSSPITARIAWLVLLVLCKLDGKAQLYKDVALSYLFLANNLRYVILKVQQSNLKCLLGEEWISKHESKVRQYAVSYEKMGWTKVISSLSEDSQGKAMARNEARKAFERFNSSFKEAYMKQSTWVVTDPKLREELKTSLGRNVLGLYRDFYLAHGIALREETYGEGIVKYAPEDVGNHLSDLFYGNGGMGSVSSSRSSTSSTSSSGSWLRHLGGGKGR